MTSLSLTQTPPHSGFSVGSTQYLPICLSCRHHTGPPTVISCLVEGTDGLLLWGPEPPGPCLPQACELSHQGHPSDQPALSVSPVCVVQPLSPQQSFRRESGASWGECLQLKVGTQVGTEHSPPSALVPRNPALPAFSLSSGKFGAVCTCTEKATGLKLAAKVIKKQTPKDKVVGGGGLLCERGGVLGWEALSPPSTHVSV